MSENPPLTRQGRCSHLHFQQITRDSNFNVNFVRIDRLVLVTFTVLTNFTRVALLKRQTSRHILFDFVFLFFYQKLCEFVRKSSVFWRTLMAKSVWWWIMFQSFVLKSQFTNVFSKTSRSERVILNLLFTAWSKMVYSIQEIELFWSFFWETIKFSLSHLPDVFPWSG